MQFDDSFDSRMDVLDAAVENRGEGHALAATVDDDAVVGMFLAVRHDEAVFPGSLDHEAAEAGGIAVDLEILHVLEFGTDVVTDVFEKVLAKFFKVFHVVSPCYMY